MADVSVGSSDHPGLPLGSDPTALTTAALQREISHLSDRIDLKIEGVLAALTARVDGIEEAAKVFSDNLNRVPTEVQKAISAEHALTGEKFAGVEQQFGELRASIEKSERITKVAVDAALEAAGKANAAQAETFLLASNKSETNFTKQIDQQGLLIQTTSNAQMAVISDIKERLTVIEARALGQAGQKTESHTSSSMIISIISLVFAILMGLLAASAYIRPVAGGR